VQFQNIAKKKPCHLIEVQWQ